MAGNQYANAITNIGEVGNIGNINVYNCQISVPCVDAASSGRLQAAINNLRHERYNLFVIGKNQDSLWRGGFSLPNEQALQLPWTSREIFEEYKNLSQENICDIISFPAIIANRNTDYQGRTDDGQQAVFAVLDDVNPDGRSLYVSYRPFNQISQRALNEMAEELGIRNSSAITEMNHDHWAIKNADLMATLKMADNNRRSFPWIKK